MKIEIALFGNPNCGKTTLFNELTGDNKSVGNWTGVTVNLEIGHFHYKDQAINIVDLPGIYSLFTHSPEQITACEYLLNYHPDVIVNIVDSTNLERNLYLTTQLVDTGIPMVIALNMTDELEKNGISVNSKALSEAIGAPCVHISAANRTGITRLMETIVSVVHDPGKCDSDRIISQFSPEVRDKIDSIAQSIDINDVPPHINPRWVALQMMKEHWQGDLPQELHGKGDEWETKIGEERYRIISEIVTRVWTKSPNVIRHEITKRLDAIICHPVWAFPIFIGVMMLIFVIAFGPPGSLLQDLCSQVFVDWLSRVVGDLLVACNAGSVLTALLIDGIIAGVGSVLVFLPQLMLLFLCLALLEFSGYMARAAFLTDKLLSRFGLSGMAFIPMVLGFGCSVPAVMSCRALDNKRERLLTMAVIPFMSCSARMPVYALFAAAFFARHQSLVIIGLYLLGIVMALVTSAVLSPRLLKEHRTFFIMEMPPYRKPVWHCIWRSLWTRTWDFISRAGTVILLASVAIWFLSNFDLQLQMTDSAHSILADIGKLIAPVFVPLGLGFWQIAVALLTGFMAKEAVVSTLAVLYAGTVPLGIALSSIISPAAALALMVFVLLYTPCVATIAAIRRESASRKFTLLVIFYQLAVAWIMAFAVYHLALVFI